MPAGRLASLEDTLFFIHSLPSLSALVKYNCSVQNGTDVTGETERVLLRCHVITDFQLIFEFKFSHHAHCSCFELNHGLKAIVSQLSQQ